MKGAEICFRYKDGVLTTEPLWPWPMNQRIIDAMKQAGRTPVDVTSTIEELFGPIPAACRWDGGTASGDLTGDGEVTLADLRLLIQMLVGQMAATAEAKALAAPTDQLTLADVRALIQLLVTP